MTHPPRCDIHNIDRFLNREMDALEVATFQMHLKSCSTCRQHVEESMAIEQQLVQANQTLSPDADCIARILSRSQAIVERHSRDEQLTQRSIALESSSVRAVPSNISQRRRIFHPWMVLGSAASIVGLLMASYVFWSEYHRTHDHRTIVADSQPRVESSESPTEHTLTSLIPAQGFLATQISTDDPDLELYLVLPRYEPLSN